MEKENGIEPIRKILTGLAAFLSFTGLAIYILLAFIPKFLFFATITWNATAGLLWIIKYNQDIKIFELKSEIRELKRNPKVATRDND